MSSINEFNLDLLTQFFEQLIETFFSFRELQSPRIFESVIQKIRTGCTEQNLICVNWSNRVSMGKMRNDRNCCGAYKTIKHLSIAVCNEVSQGRVDSRALQVSSYDFYGHIVTNMANSLWMFKKKRSNFSWNFILFFVISKKVHHRPPPPLLFHFLRIKGKFDHSAEIQQKFNAKNFYCLQTF